MPAALIVIEGPNRGAIHVLLPSGNRLGRDLDSEVPVLDERASRQHARVTLERDAWVLADDGSTNGTWLNGVRCERAALVSGDEVQVGEVSYLFSDDLAAGATGIPPAGLTTICIPLPDPQGPATVGLPVPARSTPLLGDSPAMRELQRLVLRAAPLASTVLVTGESGTGKELVARALHQNSPRRRGPLVVVNGGALTDELAASELFGHEKGAFTGAVARRKGAFELAAGGTLFLDEVGELPLGVQAALLRVLDGQGFRRLGGGEDLRPDVRLIAATNRDLPAAARAGRFREDLLHRLAVVHLELPPLRDRPGDVVLLARHLLPGLAARAGARARSLSPEALAALEAYPFPGNVRELRNLLERLTIFCEGERIELADLPPAVRGAVADTAAPLEPAEGDDAPFASLRDVERAHVARALERTGWNKARAARLLGIDRVTLYKRIERYGLSP